MKPFDIELAKQGKSVCTRNGRPVRILCHDFKSLENMPIVALIRLNEHQEGVIHYYIDGKRFENRINDLDLMMATEKKEGWINLYTNGGRAFTRYNDIYPTEEDALNNKRPEDYLTTIKIEWEE